MTSQGVFIPKQWLEGIDEVEKRREQTPIVIEPVGAEDPIFRLGMALNPSSPMLMTLRFTMTAISLQNDIGLRRYPLSACA